MRSSELAPSAAALLLVWALGAAPFVAIIAEGLRTMMSQAEMRDMMSQGLHNDTWHDKQAAHRTRKNGFKVWGVNPETHKPVIIDRGFPTFDDAVAHIAECDMEDRWWAQEAEPSDPDYYDSGEKGFWSSMSDDEYEFYSDRLDEGSLY